MPAVACTVTTSAVTASLKVAPPLLRTVRSSTLTAPETATAPWVLNTTSELVVLPVIAPALTAPLPPLPSVRVLLSAMVAVPTVMEPLPAPSVALSVAVKAPKIKPALAVVTWPARLIEAGAVAPSPPVKSRLSEAPSPSVRLPVLLNVVLPAMLFAEPVIDTL